MINQKDFTERYYPSATTTRQKDIERFLENLTELIGDTPLDEALKNTQTLCSAFYMQKAGNDISRSHYQKIKEYLLNLFEFVGVDSTVPKREEVIAFNEMTCYFGGINELLSFIDDVGNTVLQNYNPTKDLVRVKSICVFGWLGYTPEEIADIKVRDLSMIGYNGYKIAGRNGTFEIYGHPFSALYYLSDLESYKSLPNGKQQFLRGSSEFLFRPVNIYSKKLNGEDIVQIIKRFNICIPREMNTSIIFRNLHKNALFLDVYNDKSEQPIWKKIMTIMNCPKAHAFSYKEQYLKFLEVLENKKI